MHPTMTKNAEDTAEKLREFRGDRTINCLYSDRSGEIKSALKSLRIMRKTSLPGVPRTNAVIERTNRDILEGVRSVLIRAGFPACFWTFAWHH